MASERLTEPLALPLYGTHLLLLLNDTCKLPVALMILTAQRQRNLSELAILMRTGSLRRSGTRAAMERLAAHLCAK